MFLKAVWIWKASVLQADQTLRCSSTTRALHYSQPQSWTQPRPIDLLGWCSIRATQRIAIVVFTATLCLCFFLSCTPSFTFRNVFYKSVRVNRLQLCLWIQYYQRHQSNPDLINSKNGISSSTKLVMLIVCLVTPTGIIQVVLPDDLVGCAEEGVQPEHPTRLTRASILSVSCPCPWR